MKKFADRVAVVTGGASGIGFALSRTFLELSMKVVIVDYDSDNLGKAQRTLGSNRKVLFVQADVGDREQMSSTAREATRVFEKIHVLCNNAGVTSGGDVEDQDFDAWDRAMRINLGGVVNGVKIFAPLILAHGEGGHIVNTASIGAFAPFPQKGTGAYTTSKYAVRGLSESLRWSLAPQGVGVSCLCPGLTSTNIHRAKLRNETDVGELPMVDALMAGSMDPMDVARLVVEAIRNNTPYVFTHAEYREQMREIHERLLALFPRNQEIPPGRKAFEEQNWALAKQLDTLAMKD